MATNMPPHNLGKIIDATIAFIDNKDITTDEILHYIKGPDFPTGGIIYGEQGIKKMPARPEGEESSSGQKQKLSLPILNECIVVTEIPYMVNKARMIRKIADFINEKKLEGISYINDESDRNGISGDHSQERCHCKCGIR